MDRVIRTAGRHSRAQMRGLLQAIFAAELVSPSSTFWLASPWISDIPVIDNRAGTFRLGDEWPMGHVKLSKVIATIAQRGGRVVVITTSDTKNNHFIGCLHDEIIRHGVVDRVRVVKDDKEHLHEKAMVGDDFVLEGSMNFTFFGLQVRREFAEFSTNPARVALARAGMQDDFGAVSS